MGVPKGFPGFLGTLTEIVKSNSNASTDFLANTKTLWLIGRICTAPLQMLQD